jgi:hypothetical protein
MIVGGLFEAGALGHAGHKDGGVGGGWRIGELDLLVALEVELVRVLANVVQQFLTTFVLLGPLSYIIDG